MNHPTFDPYLCYSYSIKDTFLRACVRIYTCVWCIQFVFFTRRGGIFSIIGWQAAENDWSLWVARGLLSVSGIQTSVGRRTHSQWTHLRVHPLGSYWFLFPLSQKRETEKWHFRELVAVSFYNAKTSFLGLNSWGCAYALTCWKVSVSLFPGWIVHSGVFSSVPRRLRREFSKGIVLFEVLICRLVSVSHFCWFLIATSHTSLQNEVQ